MARFFAIAALLILAGCVSAPRPGTPFTPAASAPEGHANLYIYRHRAPPYIYRAEIYVDDRLVVKLPERGYAAIPVSIGAHSIRVDSFDWPDVSFSLNVEDSADVFVKFTGASTNVGGGTVELLAETYLMDPAVAEAEISACCRFIRAEGAGR